ncbi:MAG: gliding motility-associated C-terminal domain-containing protein [Bacteroidota bacterium]|nr:gliding motility-associated C-terminal domain-containing protein [Bacteroidota bacterium]
MRICIRFTIGLAFQILISFKNRICSRMKQKLYFIIFYLFLLFPAISSAQTLWAWGENALGELGDGTLIGKTTPIQIGTLHEWIKIASSGNHTIAIKKDGTLWGWGTNSTGELGNGTTMNEKAPIQIGTASDWDQISAAYSFFVAIKKDGTLWAWGSNSDGQLAANKDESVPTQIGSSGGWTQISAGFSYVVALKKDGTLWAWGNNGNGQLGIGAGIITHSNTPIQIGNSTDWMQVSAGAQHILALKKDGTLWSWGSNGNGQLGLGMYSPRNMPTQVGTSTDWSQISAGWDHSLAIKKDGSLWVWGGNYDGQLGDSTTVSESTPIQICEADAWSQISAGIRHSLAIKKNGTLWAWGMNNNSQLGDGTTVNKIIPIQVGSAVGWIQVSAGDGQTIALRDCSTTSTTNATICRGSSYTFNGTTYTEAGTYTTHLTNAGGCDSIATLNLSVKSTSGSLWAWGSNNCGQLGDGTTNEKLIPTPIGSASDWTHITAGRLHSLAIKQDGTLWVWGFNSSMMLGLAVSDKAVPTQLGSSTDWEQIVAGLDCSQALKTDGSLWAWGRNAQGELGDGTTVEKYTPKHIGTATNWDKISNMSENCVALKKDGTMWAWGYGNSSWSSNWIPTQIGSDSDWSQITAGYDFVIALKKDGTLWTWGYNWSGQLGDGTTINRMTPAQIGTSSDWIQISAGTSFVIALKKDGTLWAWGLNNWGQLGDGTIINRLAPTQVGNNNDWAQISAGAYHSTAIKKDGTLWTWGNNAFGQLGDNTIINKTVPAQIGTATDWIHIAANQTHTMALRRGSVTKANICQGNSYTFNGTTYTSAGTYTVNLTGTCGCDSTATLILSVNQPSYSTTNATICQGNSYAFNGSAYTTAGTYTTHFTNAAGCDSTATLILKVIQATSSTTNATICQGSSYAFNGKEYTVKGTYTAHLTNIGGCDSTATLILSVTPPPSSTTNATICQGSNYTFNGKTYTTAGTYSVNLSSSTGCDSIATLILKINQPSGSSTNASICQGETYLFNGTSYAMAGTYTTHLTNAAGCDSTATLILNIVPATTTEQTIYLANGENYSIGNSVYDQTGSYTDVLKTGIGCDSVVVTHIVAKIPNTISPNEDGINDVFMKGCHVKIYNRNGLLLYEGDDGWNGTYAGKPVERDTYFYVLYLPGNSKKEGYITVIRK